MKRYLQAAFFSLFFFISNTYANDVRTDNLNRFQSAVEQFSSKAQNVWPEFNVVGRPTFVYFYPDNNNDLYLFNYTPKDPSWQKLKLNTTTIYQTKRDNLGTEAFTKANLTFENKQVAFYTLSSDDVFVGNDASSMASLADAYFATYAESNPEFIKKRHYYDAYNKIPSDLFAKDEAMALLLLSNKALSNYMQTKNQEDLLDYVAIYQYRDKQINANMRLSESALVVTRLYNYIINKIVVEKDSDLTARLGNYFDFLTYFDTRHAYAPENKEDMQLAYQDQLQANETISSFVLDNVQPGWKKTYMTERATAGMLLERKYHMDDAAVDARVQKAKAKFGYDPILDNVRDAFTPFK